MILLMMIRSKVGWVDTIGFRGSFRDMLNPMTKDPNLTWRAGLWQPPNFVSTVSNRASLSNILSTKSQRLCMK